MFFFDLFGEDVGFSINGSRKLHSIPGLLTSLVILSTVGAFFIQNFNKMIEHENSTHQTILKRIDPDVETLYTKLDNVFVAISISDVYLNNIAHEGALEFSGSITQFGFDEISRNPVFS